MQSGGRGHGERHDLHCSKSSATRDGAGRLHTCHDERLVSGRASQIKRKSLQEPASEEEDEHPILDMEFTKVVQRRLNKKTKTQDPYLESELREAKVSIPIVNTSAVRCALICAWPQRTCARSLPRSLVQRRNQEVVF